MQQLTTGAAHRLNAELALRTIQSIARFDKNSSGVARRSLVLNGAMLLLSVLAIFIAARSYEQAERSAAEQQVTLDASRTALEQVLRTTTEQEKLLQQSVEMANQQLLVIRGQHPSEEIVGHRMTVKSGAAGRDGICTPLEDRGQGETMIRVTAVDFSIVPAKPRFPDARPRVTRLSAIAFALWRALSWFSREFCPG